MRRNNPFNTVLLPDLLCILLLASLSHGGSAGKKAAFKLSASFSETMITVDWPEIDNVSAFDAWVDFGDGYARANPVPVTSRHRFVFVRTDSNGKLSRISMGNGISVFITALEGENCTDTGAVCRQLFSSDTIHAMYFEGYTGILGEEQCRAVLKPEQTVDPVFSDGVSNRRNSFLKKYPCPAKIIADIYKSRIDPAEEGACVPFSTIVAKYLSGKGIECYRAQGQFIGRFHSFNLVIIDGVEYILDFTADQFLPASSPVLIPRKCCFIDSTGSPVCENHNKVTPMYIIDKIYSKDQVWFNDSPQAVKYQILLDSLLNNASGCGRRGK
jgi:hypothetical protein